MLKVSVGKSRKLSQDFNSHGFSVTVDGEISAPLDDPERLLGQIHELFDIADEALNDQLEKHEAGQSRIRTIRVPSRIPPQPAPTNRIANDNQSNAVVPRWTSANGAARVTTPEAASNKQVQYLLNIGRKKGYAKADLEAHVAHLLGFDQAKSLYELTKSEAASAIDQLLKSN